MAQGFLFFILWIGMRRFWRFQIIMKSVDKFFITIFGNWYSISVGHDKRSSHDLFNEFWVDQITPMALKKIKWFKVFFYGRECTL